MDAEIKDGLVEWHLLFGSRAVPHQEVVDKDQDKNAAFLSSPTNGGTDYVIDTTPSAVVADTLWQLTPEALEIIKGK